MLDENGRARPVTGAAAAAALGDPLFDGAGAFAGVFRQDVSREDRDGGGLLGGRIRGRTARRGADRFVRAMRPTCISSRPVNSPFGTRAICTYSISSPAAMCFRSEPTDFDYAIARDDGIWVGTQNLGRGQRDFLARWRRGAAGG